MLTLLRDVSMAPGVECAIESPASGEAGLFLYGAEEVCQGVPTLAAHCWQRFGVAWNDLR